MHLHDLETKARSDSCFLRGCRIAVLQLRVPWFHPGVPVDVGPKSPTRKPTTSSRISVGKSVNDVAGELVSRGVFGVKVRKWVSACVMVGDPATDRGRRDMSSSGLCLCRMDFGINFRKDSFAELVSVAGHWLVEDMGRSTALSILSSFNVGSQSLI